MNTPRVKEFLISLQNSIVKGNRAGRWQSHSSAINGIVRKVAAA
jgi:hypothetical protein